MKKKSIVVLMRLAAIMSFLLSLNFIVQETNLSIILLSGSVFFIFLSLNPETLLCTSVKELDELIPSLKGKTYFLGAFVILVINIIFI